MPARAGSGSTAGCRRSNAHLGVLRAAMTIDREDVPGLYFGTSTGQVFASTDEGESWTEIADYLPTIWSVEVATIGLAMADLHLPPTLSSLFADLPRRVEVDAPTVVDGDRRARASAGRASATACSSRARRSAPHIHVYVDRERAALESPLAERSRVDVIAAISGG